MPRKRTNHNREWTRGDIALLKTLISQKKTTKQIATIMKRSEAAIHNRKWVEGIKVHGETPQKPKSSSPTVTEPEVMTTTSGSSDLRDSAKAMTKVARQLARENGKRITMAMFFVEDL